MERGLVSMSFCPQCGLQLPEGSSFCYQCGTQVSEGEVIASRLEADGEPLELGLAGAEKIPRFTPHAADEPTCRFCKGPLDLSGEFCEQCGVPVSEAIASGWVRPAAAAPPIVSRQSSPPVPSDASLAVPPAAKVTSSHVTLPRVPMPSVPPHPEEKTLRTQPRYTPPPPRPDPLRYQGGKPGSPPAVSPAPSSAPGQTISGQAFAPKAPAAEPPKIILTQMPKTVVAPLPHTSAPRQATGPSPGTIPGVPAPVRVPARREEVSPVQPAKPFPLAAPSPASLPGPPAAKVTSSPATLSRAPLPYTPPRPAANASRTPPTKIPPPAWADPQGSRDGKAGKPPTAMPASPPTPAQATSAQAFAPTALAAVPPPIIVDEFGKTVAALMRQNAAFRENPGPPPGMAPMVSMPLRAPVGGEAASPAPPKRPFPLVLVVGIAGSLLAIGMVTGWHRFHPMAQSAPIAKVTAPQVNSPAPPAEIAAPAGGPLDTSPAASELPHERLQAPAPARKSRRVKAVSQAKPAPAAPATDHNSAEIVRLQNLALEACANGKFAEPQDSSAIAYAQRALALDPSNEQTRTILETSIKSGESQVRQSILSKDFTTAHRVADVLAQLLPGEGSVADLRADLARAEKAQEESRRANQAPTPVLSFRVYHMHSGKAGDKGSYCRGTLTVVAGRLKYVGENSPDGQVHSFDFACSEVEVKKSSRVAFWEKGFHVRTPSGNISFVPEDGSASHLRALAAACSE